MRAQTPDPVVAMADTTTTRHVELSTAHGVPHSDLERSITQVGS
jgi:hypothetical protein